MSVSTGNDKLGPDVSNISLIPGVDCNNCQFCFDKCYAKKFYNMYPSVKKSWGNNSFLARHDSQAYFLMVQEHLDKVKPKFFRWHVGGDILDQGYLTKMVMIASWYPKTKFLCFTKNFDLWYGNIPKNLKIFFSVWPGMDMPLQPVGIQIAWTQDGSEWRVPKKSYDCPGKCPSCMKCWTSKKDVVFHLHR